MSHVEDCNCNISHVEDCNCNMSHVEDSNCNMSHVEDCNLLHLYFDAVHKWFCDSGRKLNANRTTFIYFTCKTSSIYFKYSKYSKYSKLYCTRICVRPVFIFRQCSFIRIHVDHTAKQKFKIANADSLKYVLSLYHWRFYSCVLCASTIQFWNRLCPNSIFAVYWF
jgi:hypothetical protein